MANIITPNFTGRPPCLRSPIDEGDDTANSQHGQVQTALKGADVLLGNPSTTWRVSRSVITYPSMATTAASSTPGLEPAGATDVAGDRGRAGLEPPTGEVS